MFNLAEKEVAISEAVTISELIKNYLPESDTDKLPALIKAIANYIEKTSIQNPVTLLQEVQQSLSEPHRALQRLLIHMVTVGTSEDVLSVKMYTTGDVARFFGVSVATVNNWINQGRFQGVVKGERFKQARIPENAVYVAPTGVKTTISEAAQRYEEEQVRLGRNKPVTTVEELAELVNAVVYFENKYGGTLETTLGQRSDLTPAEKRDAEQWAGLLRSIERRNA
ncbi:helix-turn-helix domain-containing protein [Paenibacillus cisolokensis]|nr:helix-turn-helix domain-containing protein [Paenibacillus cisolokensis]